MKDLFEKIQKLKYSDELEEKIMQKILSNGYSFEEVKRLVRIVFISGEIFWGVIGLLALFLSLDTFINSSDFEVVKWLASEAGLLGSNIQEVFTILFNYFSIPGVVLIIVVVINYVLFKFYNRFKQIKPPKLNF